LIAGSILIIATLFEHFLHLLLEAHVEHLICFI
jgi:hypothetical protein